MYSGWDSLFWATGVACYLLFAFLCVTLCVYFIWYSLGAAIYTYRVVQYGWHRTDRKPFKFWGIVKFWWGESLRPTWYITYASTGDRIFWPWPWVTKKYRQSIGEQGLPA